MNRWTDRRGSLISCSAGVNILQKEEDFDLGILGMLLGRIPGFLWNDHKILTISRKKSILGKNHGVSGRISYCLHLKSDNLLPKT